MAEKKQQKRFRVRKATPGQLIIYFGRTGDEGRGEPPDICASNGDGCDDGDARLLLFTLMDAPSRYGGDYTHGLLKELEARGYDLTTISFSIEKK